MLRVIRAWVRYYVGVVARTFRVTKLTWVTLLFSIVSLTCVYIFVRSSEFFWLQALFCAGVLVSVSLRWEEVVWSRVQSSDEGYRFLPGTLITLMYFAIQMFFTRPPVWLWATALLMAALSYLAAVLFIEMPHVRRQVTHVTLRRCWRATVVATAIWFVMDFASAVARRANVVVYYVTIYLSAVLLGILSSYVNNVGNMQRRLLGRR